MRTVFVVFMSLFCASCKSLSPEYIPIEHTQLDGSVNEEAKRIYNDLARLDPGPRLIAGKSLVDRKCDIFFEELDNYQNKSDFLAKRLTELSAVLPPVFEANGTSLRAAANALAAIGYFNSSVQDQKSIFLLSEFSPQIKQKWDDSKSIEGKKIAILAAAIISGRSTGSVVTDTLIRDTTTRDQVVNMVLYNYSRLCLKTQFKKYLHEHANNPVGIVSPKDPIDRSPIISFKQENEDTILGATRNKKSNSQFKKKGNSVWRKQKRISRNKGISIISSPIRGM